MVKAILNGSKTQTRRIIKPQPKFPEMDFKHFLGKWAYFETPQGHEDPTMYHASKKVEVGDIFWVRETWAEVGNFASSEIPNSMVIAYRTEEAFFYQGGEKLDTDNWNWDKIKWKPSIYMPKNVCRIFLECTNVRVERLHDISEEDSISEGIRQNCHFEQDTSKCLICTGLVCRCEGEYYNYMAEDGDNFPTNSAKESFFTLWESINGKKSLEENPWLWVYDFKVVETPEDFK